jgi:RimJ/RimL family protein N-acetyltransferase
VNQDEAGAQDAASRRVAYRIVTDRLLIRNWEPADAPRLRTALDELDAYLRPWIPWMRHEPASLAATAARLRAYRGSFDLDRDYRYGVLAPDDTALIGEVGLYPRIGPNAREIGYWMHERHAGRGYGFEAAAAMVRIGFEIDRIDRIEIHCMPENLASAIIPRKLGFRHDATLPNRAIDSEGAKRDLMIWTMFADDYPGSAASQVALAAYDCLGERLL